MGYRLINPSGTALSSILEVMPTNVRKAVGKILAERRALDLSTQAAVTVYRRSLHNSLRAGKRLSEKLQRLAENLPPVK